jgi:hypothetical protein
VNVERTVEKTIQRDIVRDKLSDEGQVLGSTSDKDDRKND